MTKSRKLVVNADDFGFTRDVNEGIIEAHRSGILGATTLMANGPAFEHAVRLASENPLLDVGCHLVLAGGESVATPGEALPESVGALLRAVAFGKIDVHAELAAQVRKILDAGIKPLHLDTHKHTHLLPPVLDAVGRVSREFGIRWVRRPFDLPLTEPADEIPWAKRATSRSLSFLRLHFHSVLRSYGCLTTDHFAGFQITGRFGTQDLVRLIEGLPDGVTELMTHPGYCGEELMGARTRLKESRERELEALVAPATREAIERSGVQVVRYRDLRG